MPANTPMVTFENAQYSVPAFLLGARVFVRSHGIGAGEEVIIVHVGLDGPLEVARHLRARPGSPAIEDAHFPDHRPRVPDEYSITARSAAETEFLAIGAGARAWLLEAAAAGTTRMTMKMAEAVALAKISGTAQVDQAPGTAATYSRFATGDLASLLTATGSESEGHRADEAASLAQGTAGWASIGHPVTPVVEAIATDDDLEDSA